MNYEEKYNEALERAKKLHDSYNLMHISVDEIEQIFPELAESEDERIRKFLVDYFASYKIGDVATKLNGVRIDDILAYLEKQKTKEKQDRMMPVYNDRDSFESALEKAWKSYNESGSRTVDSCEDDYVECAHAKGFREGFLFGVGKQKEPVVDKEGMYYYLGGKFIYCGYPATEENPYDFAMSQQEKQKEQKPVESISQLTVQGKGVYKICPRCKERMVRDDSMVYTSMPPQYRYECPKCGESECDTVMYDNPETDEQKPAENGVDVIKTSALLAADRLASAEMTGRLKERSEILDNPTKYGLQKPAEWSEEDEACIRNLESIIYYNKKLPNDTRVILGKFLSNLRSKSHWKPSEEQMAALNVLNLHGDLSYVGQQNQLISLYNDLKKLM